MSKKSGNFFTFLTGAIVGAAAVFLSKDKNREQARNTLESTKKKVMKLKQTYHQDPEKFKKEVLSESKQVASKVKSEATHAAHKASQIIAEKNSKAGKSIKKSK